MQNKKFAIIVTASITVVAALIGAVVYYGAVVQPKEIAARVAQNNLAACDHFEAGVAKGLKEAKQADFFADVFQGTKDGLDVYLSKGSPALEANGEFYWELLDLVQMESAITDYGQLAYDQVGEEIALVKMACGVLKENKGYEPNIQPTATPTPTN